MEAIKLPVYNWQGEEVDSVSLDAAVFGIVNKEAIHQAVVAFNANHRKGLAATKTRGEVSGGGRKPWKQKGTGRARAGSTRSPLWRHGGVVFGPHPRDFSFTLPAKIKTLALKSAISAKIKEADLIVMDALVAETPKTKEMSKVFANLKLQSCKSILVLFEKIEKNTAFALRNINALEFNKACDTNVYEVLAHEKVIITKDALSILTKRFTPLEIVKTKTGKTKISNGI